MARISREEPPVWGELMEKFNVPAWHKANVAVTYDGVIYSRHELPPDVFTHELVHVRQQSHHPGGARAFLDRYIADPEFRQRVEFEAYREQYQFICSIDKDPNARARARAVLAEEFRTAYNSPLHAAAIEAMLSA